MRALIACVLCALLTVGCGTIAQPTPTATPAPTAESVDMALIQYGVDTYLYYYCGTCHTLSIANTRGTFGPPHDNAAIQAARYIASDEYYGSATTVAEYLRESIIDPKAFFTPGFTASNHQMPAFTNLSTEQVDALIYMLMYQIAPQN